MLYHRRLQVDTPQLYAHLLAGRFDGQFDLLNVTSDAHANILAEAKSFADNVNAAIKFTDEHGNSIELAPAHKLVLARCKVGNANLANLPSNYKIYRITYDTNAILTAADAETVSNWTSVDDIFMINNVNSHDREFWRKVRPHTKIYLSGPLICVFDPTKIKWFVDPRD